MIGFMKTLKHLKSRTGARSLLLDTWFFWRSTSPEICCVIHRPTLWLNHNGIVADDCHELKGTKPGNCETNGLSFKFGWIAGFEIFAMLLIVLSVFSRLTLTSLIIYGFEPGNDLLKHQWKTRCNCRKIGKISNHDCNRKSSQRGLINDNVRTCHDEYFDSIKELNANTTLNLNNYGHRNLTFQWLPSCILNWLKQKTVSDYFSKLIRTIISMFCSNKIQTSTLVFHLSSVT